MVERHHSMVLVTGAAGPAGLALGRQLPGFANAIAWCGADMAEVDDPNYAHTALVPAANDPAYAPGMLRCILDTKADLVIPTVSDELSQIAVLAEAQGWRRPGVGGQPGILVSGPGPTAIAADKLLTMWALARSGIPVPRFAAATEFSSTAAAMRFAAGPIVVKPRVSRGGRGVRLVESATDLDWASTGPGSIVQGFAPGTEFCPQVYTTLGGETTVVLLEKTELKQGRVGNAAATVRRDNTVAPDVVEVARGAVTALDLVGPIDLDIRLDRAGQPVVLEVNARFGANSAMAPEMLQLAFDEWLVG